MEKPALDPFWKRFRLYATIITIAIIVAISAFSLLGGTDGDSSSAPSNQAKPESGEVQYYDK